MNDTHIDREASHLTIVRKGILSKKKTNLFNSCRRDLDQPTFFYPHYPEIHLKKEITEKLCFLLKTILFVKIYETLELFQLFGYNF